MTLLPRHNKQDTENQPLRAGDVELDPTAYAVIVHGQRIALSPQEYRILAMLLRHADRVVPSKYLLDQLWGPGYAGDPGTLSVHILRLRNKLDRYPDSWAHIRTVRGVGYVFDSAQQAGRPRSRPDRSR